jgi:hypothetical protein
VPTPTAAPVRRLAARRTFGMTVAVALVAAASASAQQASAAIAVSVTVVRSATIDVPTTALLSGGVAAQTAATSVTIRPGTMSLPTAPARATPLTASTKTGLPVVAPPADGRPLSIQF